MKEEGFAQAETVAKLLADKKLQDALEGQVSWVDEAGLLGTKDISGLLELATKKNARLILGSDTRQHSSIVRGRCPTHPEYGRRHSHKGSWPLCATAVAHSLAKHKFIRRQFGVEYPMKD